ncbi:MAG: hypothetical protein Q9227_004350 [Pyrenula ochraceoflavens]
MFSKPPSMPFNHSSTPSTLSSLLPYLLLPTTLSISLYYLTKTVLVLRQSRTYTFQEYLRWGRNPFHRPPPGSLSSEETEIRGVIEEIARAKEERDEVLRGIEKERQKIRREKTEAAEEVEDAKRELSRVWGQIESAREEREGLRREIKVLKGDEGVRVRTERDLLRSRVGEMKREMGRLEGKIEGLNQEIGRLNWKVRGLENERDEMGREVERASQKGKSKKRGRKQLRGKGGEREAQSCLSRYGLTEDFAGLSVYEGQDTDQQNAVSYSAVSMQVSHGGTKRR